jgi:hypothetical protein
MAAEASGSEGGGAAELDEHAATQAKARARITNLTNASPSPVINAAPSLQSATAI